MYRPLLLLLCLLPLSAALAAPVAAPEQAMLLELNRARGTPALYAQQLEAFRATFQGSFYFRPGSPIRYQTREGVAAVDEAIAFLKRQPPLPPLQWSEGLAAAARELTVEQGQSGALGHGAGSLSMEARIERHGNWTIGYAENVGYGDFLGDAAREIVQLLIVDDGVPGRGHRRNIFNGDYALAGIACGPHPQRRNVCVIDFAGGSAAEGR